MPLWTPHCSNETHKNDIVITFILLFEYPTTTTSSISWDVYREQRSLRRCHHVDNHWFLFGSYHVVSIRHTHFTFTINTMLFIYHSLDAAIVFSRIVDSVYSVWIHNGWWFSYPVIWFGPSEGRNDKASWLWPSSRPNQMDLILMDYCTWQFLVSLRAFATKMSIDSFSVLSIDFLFYRNLFSRLLWEENCSNPTRTPGVVKCNNPLKLNPFGLV